MKRKHSDILRKRLNEVPMPQPGWEARMASYILNYEQEKRPQLVTWLAELSGFFYRHKVARPALAVALLGLSYFIQPIHLYNSVAAERERRLFSILRR